MSEKEKVFAKGFWFSRNENAPEYVIGSLDLTTKDAIKFISENSKDGKLKLSIKKSQGGKFYLEVDTYVGKKKDEPVMDEGPDLPF